MWHYILLQLIFSFIRRELWTKKQSLPWGRLVGVLVPADSSGRQPGLHQAKYDFLKERKKFLTFCCISEQKQQTKAAVNYNPRTGVCPSKVRSVVYSLDFEVCAIVSLLTQQSSKAGQVLCLEPELPGGLGQQILVCGQVLSIPAQFERMRGKVGGDVAEGKLWILSDQACKSIVPVEREHFLVVVLQSLYNL